MPQPELPIERFEVYASELDHPECIAFAHDGQLWAGGEAGQVYRIDAVGQVHTVVSLGGFTGICEYEGDAQETVPNGT